MFAERISALRLLDFVEMVAKPNVALAPCSFRLFAVSCMIWLVSSEIGPPEARRLETMSVQDGHQVTEFETSRAGSCR